MKDEKLIVVKPNSKGYHVEIQMKDGWGFDVKYIKDYEKVNFHEVMQEVIRKIKEIEELWKKSTKDSSKKLAENGTNTSEKKSTKLTGQSLKIDLRSDYIKEQGLPQGKTTSSQFSNIATQKKSK